MLRSFAASLRRDAHGHYWTYAGFVLSQLQPRLAGDDEPVRFEHLDQTAGRIEIEGRLARRDDNTCVVVLHGLGGDVQSRYVQLAASAAARAGKSCLRLGLRGANLDGSDIYHAGLTDDLRVALASPLMASFKRIELLGYSMGGHITLRYVADAELHGIDSRVSAVASVCAPLDLERAVDAIQRADRRPYQYHVLRALKAHYRAVERRAAETARPLPCSSRDLESVTNIRDWDERVICPRFGFASPHAYYSAMSIGQHLAQIRVPTLMAIAEADPMVPLSTLEPWLGGPSNLTTWRFQRGGHVAFPKGIVGRDVQLEDEIVAWLGRSSS